MLFVLLLLFFACYYTCDVFCLLLGNVVGCVVAGCCVLFYGVCLLLMCVCCVDCVSIVCSFAIVLSVCMCCLVFVIVGVACFIIAVVRLRSPPFFVCVCVCVCLCSVFGLFVCSVLRCFCVCSVCFLVM